MTTRIDAFISHNKLIDDIPDTIQDITAKHLYDGTPILDGIKTELVLGMFAASEKYYDFGRQYYPGSFPIIFSGDFLNLTPADIKQVLDGRHGEPVTVLGYESRSLWGPSVTLQWLYWYYDYSYVTQQVQGVPGTPTNVSVFFTGNAASYNPDIGPSTQLTAAEMEVSKYIEFSWTPVSGSQVTQYILIKMDTYTKYATFISARYYLDSDPSSTTLLFFYPPEAGEFPLFNLGGKLGTSIQYYPMAPIRINEISLPDFADTSVIDNTTDLLNKISMVPDDLISALNGDADNPTNLEDLDNVYVQYALDIQTQTDVGIQYFMEHFTKVGIEVPRTQQEVDDWIAGGGSGTVPWTNTHVSTDAYNVSIYHSHVVVQDITGSIGPVGSFSSDTTVLAPYYFGHNDNNAFELSSIGFREQTGTNTYREVRVYGLIVGANIGNKYVETTLGDSLDSGINSLILPIRRDVVIVLPLLSRSELLYESLHLVIHGLVETKLAWYATAAFGALLKVISIVVAVYTLGTSAAASSSLTAFAKAVIIDIIIGAAVKIVLKLVVKAVGGEAALILAAIASIIGIAYGTGDGKMPWAEDLLKAATALVEATNAVTKDDFLTLQDEIENFNKSAEELQEELDNAEALLGTGSLALYAITRGGFQFNPEETPGDFYTRTIHNNNPGVLALSAPQHFVTNALALPDFTI